MKYFTFVCLLFLSCSSLYAQQNKESTGFMYGIMSSLDSGTHISFLFGTLHHLDGNFLLKDHPQILQLASGAEVLVCEADPKASDEYHTTDWMKMRSDTSLKDLLPHKEFTYVEDEFLKATGQPIEPYLHLYPFVIRSMIKQARAYNKPPEEIEYRIVPDLLFQRLAQKQGIPLKGLESAGESLAAQASIPIKEQAFLLLEGLDDSKIDSLILDMNDCYIAQDLTCFCKIMDLEHYTYPGDEQMLKQRNLLWMKKLPRILREKRAFTIVGAGHLCGEYGLLSLLKKEGFVIIPMQYP